MAKNTKQTGSKASSAAISHFTSTGSSSSVRSRVHRITEVGRGSPDATPRPNGSDVSGDAGVETFGEIAVVVDPAVLSPVDAESSDEHDTTTVAPPRPSAVRKVRRSTEIPTAANAIGGDVSVLDGSQSRRCAVEQGQPAGLWSVGSKR